MLQHLGPCDTAVLLTWPTKKVETSRCLAYCISRSVLSRTCDTLPGMDWLVLL